MRPVLACIASAIGASLPWIGLMLHFRQQLQQRIARDARAAEEALAGLTRVDGIALPLPSDTRWKRGDMKLQNGQKPECLILGHVTVSDENLVYVRPAPGGSAFPQKSVAFEPYARAVWLAHYERLARTLTE